MNVHQNIRQRLNNLSAGKWLAVILIAGMIIFWFILPKKMFVNPTSYVIEDAGGNLLSAVIASDGQWRFPQNPEVPQKFIDCITTFEDKRFFTHPGVDLISIGRAGLANIKKGRQAEGGSTLTMQVVRMASKHNERNLLNKLKETTLAIRLEISFSKKEILAMYASNAPFGSNVVGLDAAAWRYFGRSADKLSWGEMATLAVLPNAPSLVHPGKNQKILLSKRNRLLDKLVSSGKLSATDAQLAKAESLPGKPFPLPQTAPHLLQRFKKQSGQTRESKIKTTINGSLQQHINAIIQQHHNVLKGNGINNICALVLDVETGNTLAYAGNIYDPANADLESDVDVINSRRSPGSALKPILYAAMLSDGLMLPNALIADIPTEIAGYTPKNFELQYHGAVPAAQALARSLNIPAVRSLQQYKYARFYELLRSCGITTLNNPADFYGLSMILGGCEVTMWELAGVYASFARILNNQEKHRGIMDASDIHPPAYIAQTKKINSEKNINLDATSIYFTFQAMQEVMRPGEEGLWQQFTSSQKIAWKTGTSFGFRDGWAIGITPKNVVAVWVGNADGEGRPGLTGVHTAAPVMFDIFRLLPAVSWFKKPVYNYEHVRVCRQSGFRANIDCPDAEITFSPPNALKTPLCNYHRVVQLDPTGLFQVNEQCESPMNMVQKSWFVLPPTMEYYYRQNNHDYAILPPFKNGCQASSNGKQLEIIYPPDDARIYVPVEISGEKGRTIFSATHRNKNATIFWSIDDTFIAETSGSHQLAVNPPPGKHLLTLTDNSGNSISRWFEIIGK